MQEMLIFTKAKGSSDVEHSNIAECITAWTPHWMTQLVTRRDYLGLEAGVWCLLQWPRLHYDITVLGF